MATTFQSPTPSKKSRHRVIVGAMLAMVLIGGIASFFIKSSDAPVRKTPSSTIINITLPPPPPPPPLPPPPATEPPPQVEQEMVEAEAPVEDEPPPEAKAPDEPPSDLTTNLKGDGPNSFGLAQGNGKGGGGGNIGGTGIGGTGSKYGRYNAGLARTIESALKSHPATRNAKFTLGRTALWIDSNGLITRAKLLDSTGDTTLDQTIANQILPGIRYQALPEGMPSPVNIRITARKQ